MFKIVSIVQLYRGSIGRYGYNIGNNSIDLKD